MPFKEHGKIGSFLNIQQSPVRIIGYLEDMVGVAGEGIREGMEVVVKGNERLQDGQPVETLIGAMSKNALLERLGSHLS